MKYVRYNGLLLGSDSATHVAKEGVYDATMCGEGYLRKDSLCRIGESWDGPYGELVAVYDMSGALYEVEKSDVDAYLEELPSSDTIEELCDYAVYYNLEKELIFRKLPLSTSWKSLYRDTKLGLLSDVKLAILTDKGLIYVAKMNEKGEFELL